MRIVTWNCNRALRRKLGPLLELDPDVAVIQECEKSVQPPDGYTFFWHGLDVNKGLGILAKSPIAPLQHPICEQTAFFVPVFFPVLDLRLLAVWAFNHRVERFDPPRTGAALDAIEQVSNWLASSRSAVVGDFNNNASWDKKLKSNNFRDISNRLTSLGLVSAYHQVTGEEYGQESAMTHYWRKSDATRYHIDYCFVHKALDVASVSIPTFEPWRALSDHVPVLTVTPDLHSGECFRRR